MSNSLPRRTIAIAVLAFSLTLSLALPALAVTWVLRESGVIESCLSGDYTTRIVADGEHRHKVQGSTVDNFGTSYRTTEAGFLDGPSTAQYYLYQGQGYSNWSYAGSQAWCA